MQVTVVARAKINLSLLVLGLRADGYHDLSSVMQAVELADHLTLRPAAATTVILRPGEGFEGSMPQAPELVEQAIGAFSSARKGGHAHALVVKRIPIGAGLAGGSADAAAALVGMNALAGSLCSLEDLTRIGEHLGADVPFALHGGTALVTGRGERVCGLACPVRLWWVLGMPASSISTHEAYRRYDELASGHGQDARAAAEDPKGVQAALIAALASGSAKDVAACMRNDLELAAFDLEPTLPGLKRRMLEAGALGAVVSGSGPTVAGLCSDESHAAAVGAQAARYFARVDVVPSAKAGAEVAKALSMDR